MNISMTEAEFWCVCGKYASSYARTHPQRAPLVSNIMSSLTSVSSTSSRKADSDQKSEISTSVESSISLESGGSSNGEQGKHKTHEALESTSSLVLSDDDKSVIGSEVQMKTMDDLEQKEELPEPSLVSERDISTIAETHGQEIEEKYSDNLDKEDESEEQLREVFKHRISRKYSKALDDIKLAENEAIKMMETKSIEKMETGSIKMIETGSIKKMEGESRKDTEKEFGEKEKKGSRRKMEIQSKATKTETDDDEYSDMGEEVVSKLNLGSLDDDSEDAFSVQSSSARDTSPEHGKNAKVFEDELNKYQDMGIMQSDYSGEQLYAEEDYDEFWITEMLHELIDNQFERILSEDKMFEEPLRRMSPVFDLRDSRTSTSSQGSFEFTGEDLHYLHKTLGDCLVLGITDIIRKRPLAPIPYLAQYIMLYKADKFFDRSTRNEFRDMITMKSEHAEQLSKLYTYKCKIGNCNLKKSKEEKKVLELANIFTHEGKITLRRGRRIRKCILDICDSLIEKSPLITLQYKIMRSQTLKNIIKYMLVVIKSMGSEVYYTKTDNIRDIYLDVLKFLAQILPEMDETCIEFEDYIAPFCPIRTIDSSSSEEFRIYENLRNVVSEKFSEYNVINSKCACQSDKRVRLSSYVSDGQNLRDAIPPITKTYRKIIHIEKSQVCQMCEDISKIINKIKEKYKNMHEHLIMFFQKRFNKVGVIDM